MGIWPSSYQNISRSKNHESIHPAIGVLNGNVYTCWMEAEAPRRLYFCEKVNKRWRSPQELRRSGYYPDMVVDDSGNIHIVFSLRDGNFHYLTRMGSNWRSDEVISNGECPLQFGDIAHKNNVVVAAWIQGQDGNWSVYATGKIVGDQWAIPVKVADTPGGGDGNKHVQVALDNNNCAHFVWEGIGHGGKHDIFYEKYCVDTPDDATFIEVDNSYLSFHKDGSSDPSPKTFRVRASGPGSINYSIAKNKGWLDVSPLQGSSSGEWDTITVSVNASSLGDGSYNGTITITDPQAYNSPVEVGVSLTIGDEPSPPSPPSSNKFIEVDRVNMDFSMEEGVNPAAKSFSLRVTGGGSLNYSITANMPWLEIFPTEGTASSTWVPISVSIEAENMLPGTHRGRIDVRADGAANSKESVFVTLTIEPKKTPAIQLNRSSFYFWGYAHGDNPPSSTFKIRNSGSKTLNYQITSNKGWLKANPSQGISTGEWDTITVTADSSSLGVGRHRGNIQIKASGADNSPQNISVEFEVERPPVPYPPVNIVYKRMNHVGLVIQEYMSKIDWNPNSRNQGLFDIVKHRIYKRNQHQHNAPYIYIGEVAANVFVYFDGGYPSAAERNKYVYSVTCVDGAGKESLKTESIGLAQPLYAKTLPKSRDREKTSPQKKEIR
jgi:hypothetical protein